MAYETTEKTQLNWKDLQEEMREGLPQKEAPQNHPQQGLLDLMAGCTAKSGLSPYLPGVISHSGVSPYSNSLASLTYQNASSQSYMGLMNTQAAQHNILNGLSGGLGSVGTHTEQAQIAATLPTRHALPPIAPYKRPAYLLWNLLKPVPRLLVDRLSNGKRSKVPTP